MPLLYSRDQRCLKKLKDSVFNPLVEEDLVRFGQMEAQLGHH